MPYMYVIVRKDLTTSQQLVQACHAVAEAAALFLAPEQIQHLHIVACGVKNEAALRKSQEKIQQQSIRCRTFIESDLNDQATALATEAVYAEQRHIFRPYQLLKSEEAKKKEVA